MLVVQALCGRMVWFVVRHYKAHRSLLLPWIHDLQIIICQSVAFHYWMYTGYFTGTELRSRFADLEALHMILVDWVGSVYTEMKLFSVHIATFSPLSEMTILKKTKSDMIKA